MLHPPRNVRVTDLQRSCKLPSNGWGAFAGARTLGSGLDYFLTTVLNYPTLVAECYEVAAFNAANTVAFVRQATASAAASTTPR
jgi:hypothetical protein